MAMNFELRAYRRARRRFALKTYVFLAIWLLLALVQWIIVCLIQEARNKFRELYYICFTAFATGICLFTLFIYCEKLRYVKVVKYLISFIIVELQITSLFGLVVYSWWADVLTFYALCVLLIILCFVIGAFLPKKVDLTLDVAIIFIVAFIFLMVAVFCLMFFIIATITVPYTYLFMELGITITIMLFVMYHTQTILGSRFAEMRLDDYLLGSLILFHDFLIIYWMTFYWQVKYRIVTSDSYIATSTTSDSLNGLIKPHFRSGDFYDEMIPSSLDGPNEDTGHIAYHNRNKHKDRNWNDYPYMTRDPDHRDVDRIPQRVPQRNDDDWSIYRYRQNNRPHKKDGNRNKDFQRGGSRNRYGNRIPPTIEPVNDDWHRPDLNRNRNDYNSEDIHRKHDLSPEHEHRDPDERIPGRRDNSKVTPLDDWLTTYDDRDNVRSLRTEELIMPPDNNYRISLQSSNPERREHHPRSEFDYDYREEGARRIVEQITQNPNKVFTELGTITPEIIVEEFKDDVEILLSDNDEAIDEEPIDEEPLTTVDATEASAYEKLSFTNPNKSTRKFDL